MIFNSHLVDGSALLFNVSISIGSNPLITAEEWKIWDSLLNEEFDKKRPGQFNKRFDTTREFSEKILLKLENKTKTRHIKLLVDGYGLFKGAKEFWKAKVGTDNSDAILRIGAGALSGVIVFFGTKRKRDVPDPTLCRQKSYLSFVIF